MDYSVTYTGQAIHTTTEIIPTAWNLENLNQRDVSNIEIDEDSLIH